jgi:hypothetical protein
MFTLALVSAAAAFSGSAAAQTKPTRAAPAAQIASLMWVGNSFFYYNNSMHNHVGALYRSAVPASNLRSVSVTISGSGIDWHDLASLLRPEGIGRYSFRGENQIVFNPPGRQFDAVLIMDCSQCPVHPELRPVFHEQAARQARIARERGVEPLFFMSWAYKDKPEMTAGLAEEYTTAGNANNALVVPAGLAFARAIAARPDLELYTSDKRHPSLAGTYLAAATVYAALTGTSPEPLTYAAGLPPDVASFLRKMAWETVQDYYRR